MTRNVETKGQKESTLAENEINRTHTHSCLEVATITFSGKKKTKDSGVVVSSSNQFKNGTSNGPRGNEVTT